MFETREKEFSVMDYVEMTRKSWTWGRMTDEERENCLYAFQWADEHSMIGSYKQRWNTCHAIYTAFLAGLGYTRGANWREDRKEA